MKDRDLIFDRKTHLLYSKAVRRVIQKELRADYPEAEAEALWEQTQREYVKILDLIPNLGGKKNMQAQAVYDCAALFAYYTAVPDKPTLEEFGRMNEELFLPDFTRLRFVNLNNHLLMNAAWHIWNHLAKVNRRHRRDWPGNYLMEMVPVPEGAKYLFHRCPIAELAKKLGYTHLMGPVCNPDYPMIRAMHGRLIRTETCAFGACCDFWIVGSESRFVREHPERKSETGFLYNE